MCIGVSKLCLFQLNICERFFSLYPNYEQAMNNLANVLREDGNASESEVLLRKAISIR